MALDPIVSLAVALAEAPGACACLLGSGVSVDAGIPTGWAIYEDGLRRLYRLEHKTEETPDDDGLANWLASAGRSNLGYSSLLDLIAPDPAIRRSLLAGYFENIDPGPTHIRLAELAAEGAIRVFVTTNFDRLLERALQAHGIEPVVVSDDATLTAAPRREHAEVYILKAHGDYLQETIRNTPSELAALEPALTTELQAIANNYGLLVLGWSGSDPALAEVLRNRRSRYGVWWLSLTDPQAEPGRSLAEAIGARIIVRTGASDFLGDLSGRLAVYAAHESGHDPGTVHDEILALVRRRDDIGLDEALRRERHAFEVTVGDVITDHVQHHLDEPTVRDAWGRLGAASDRRLASLIPLALHRPELLEAELRAHAGWATGTPMRDGSTTWQEPWRMPFWTLGMTLGALLVRLERYGALKPIIATTWVNHYRQAEAFVDHPGQTSDAVAAVFGPAPPANQRWSLPAWTWLVNDLPTKEWLVERYPDWLRRDGEPAASLIAFAILLNIAAGLRGGGNGVAYWSLNSGAAQDYARRLHADPHLRQLAAAAVGLSVQEFDQQAPEILAAARGIGMFPSIAETVNALRTGSAY